MHKIYGSICESSFDWSAFSLTAVISLTGFGQSAPLSKSHFPCPSTEQLYTSRKKACGACSKVGGGLSHKYANICHSLLELYFFIMFCFGPQKRGAIVPPCPTLSAVPEEKNLQILGPWGCPEVCQRGAR